MEDAAGDVTGQMEDEDDWNGFLSDAVTERTRGDGVVEDWKPGDPVTPQYVQTLAGYTQ
ncbi:protein unc, partial [Clarias magur]